jgi:hypothetical protein
MDDHDAPEQDSDLSPGERARLRARDRKRITRMVVDNAGVKRILQARRDRAATRAIDKDPSTAGRTPGGHRSGGR